MKAFNPLPSHEGRLFDETSKLRFYNPFNPLPSHEGRQMPEMRAVYDIRFQSTSLSRGKTASDGSEIYEDKIFQSTSLSRGKTYTFQFPA